MTIPYRIVVGEPVDYAKKKQIQKVVDQTFAHIDRVYNKWNPFSEISKINSAPKNTPIALSLDLQIFFTTIDRLVLLTEHRFDPTIEPIQQLWKSHLEAGKLPSPEKISTLQQYIGWEKINFHENTINKVHQEVSLDLGGIAKGFAIDLIADKLDQMGFHNLYVEWGGDLTTRGMHPNGRPWRVLVTKWGIPGDTNTVVELSGNAIASSGDYLQNWTVNNSTYAHLFNPFSGEPVRVTNQSICSVTIVAPTCLLADTIATAAMLCESPQEAVEWLRNVQQEFPTLNYWVFTRSTPSPF